MDTLLRQIEQSLSRALDNEIRLEKCSQFKKQRIRRCWVAEGHHLPEVLLVKMARQTKAEPYDRQRDYKDSSAWKLFNEWATLEFLGEVAGNKGIAPRFFAGDAERGLIAFEYMPKTQSLRDILRQGNTAKCAEALLAYAQAVGRLHGCSYGKEDTWLRLRGALGDWQEEANLPFDVTLRRLRRLSGWVGTSEPTALEDELVQAFAQAESFSALTHVDIAPQNYLFVGGEIKLVDFEYSRYGFCLLDAPVGPYPFPVRWEVDEGLVQEIERVYRWELSRGFGGVLDDAVYYKGLVLAWIYWLLRLGPIPNKQGIKSNDAALLARRCTAVARLSDEIEYLPRLRGLFERVAQACGRGCAAAV